MNRRSYGQYCGLATALDIIGERWTALIIRDLAITPRRFTDLLAGLKGLGTSLLSERLRHLEEARLVERAVADRAAGGGVVYRLTPEGERVARALTPLAMWGATRVDGSAADFRPDWLMFVLRASFRPDLAGGVEDCYEFRIDGHALWAAVRNGSIDVTTDQPRQPDFIATMSLATLASIGAGELDPVEAAASGAAVYEGDADAGLRALRLLGSATDGASAVRERKRPRRAAGAVAGAGSPRKAAATGSRGRR